MTALSKLRQCLHLRCWFLGLFFLLLSSAQGSEGRYRFVRGESGRWQFSKGSVADALPYVIGLNHVSRVNFCDEIDTECRKEDVLHRVFGGNTTLAELDAVHRFSDWQFNSAGYDAPGVVADSLLYFQSLEMLDIHQWQQTVSFPDVFSGKVVKDMEETVASTCGAAAPHRDRLLGYYWDDVVPYDVLRSRWLFGTDWVSSIRESEDGGGAGKRRYLEFLKERYQGNATRLCEAYGLPSGRHCSWEEIDRIDWRSVNTSRASVLSDDYSFLDVIAEQVFSVGFNSTKKCDPDAILLGTRFIPMWTPDSVIKVSSRYTDAVSFQPQDSEHPAASGFMPFNVNEFERYYDLVDRKMPIVIADQGFGFPQPPYNATQWKQFPSVAESAKAYRDYLLGSFHSGFIAAFVRCQYIDRYVTRWWKPDQTLHLIKQVSLSPPRSLISLTQGMIEADLSPHTELVDLVRAANAEVWDIASRH